MPLSFVVIKWNRIYGQSVNISTLHNENTGYFKNVLKTVDDVFPIITFKIY